MSLTFISISHVILPSTLSVLTRQVEASTREVSQLQAKVDHAHSQGVQDREHSTRAQEEHLKCEHHETETFAALWRFIYCTCMLALNSTIVTAMVTNCHVPLSVYISVYLSVCLSV